MTGYRIAATQLTIVVAAEAVIALRRHWLDKAEHY